MNVKTIGLLTAVFSLPLVALTASAQDGSIYVQCPMSTTLHPQTQADIDAGKRADGIKCRHLVAGDGMVTMADDQAKTQYIFSFAELPENFPGDADGDTQPGQPAQNSPEYASWVMEQGMLAANAPAPTIDLDEDDELFLSLTNVGMTMRPDLFDPHTVHWHGFPQAAAVFDGVPDASISINMGATLTYYYLAKDAGTYMYHLSLIHI